jgi:hypothetical protein
MNIPLLPIHFWDPRVIPSLRSLLPGPIACFRALCLLPLALPGVRVVLSGLAWFEWLQGIVPPLSWLLAIVLIGVFHIAIPLLVAAGFYQVVRTLWPSETPHSLRHNFWFAGSTIAILVTAFLGTVGGSFLAENSICQWPQVTALVGGSCSNHFINSSPQEWLSSMETYNFRWYNWLVWWAIAAVCYQQEKSLRERWLARRPGVFPMDSLEVTAAPELDTDTGSEMLDLEGPTTQYGVEA